MSNYPSIKPEHAHICVNNNVLTSDQISSICDMNEVQCALNELNNNDLPGYQRVQFEIVLPTDVKARLEQTFGLDFSEVVNFPCTWARGDIQTHTDAEWKDGLDIEDTFKFKFTNICYLSNSSGNFIVNGQPFPIKAGNTIQFEYGLEHNSKDTPEPRLMIGPFSENMARLLYMGYSSIKHGGGSFIKKCRGTKRRRHSMKNKKSHRNKKSYRNKRNATHSNNNAFPK